MRAKQSFSVPPQQLRGNAEARVAGTRPANPVSNSSDGILHELQVHQIELQMQNEALHQALVALEESRNRYADLYEFAPVGYLTLTATGVVIEANTTGATLLGMEVEKLPSRHFDTFVRPEDRERWSQRFASVVQHQERAGIEVMLKRGSDNAFHAWLDCVCVTGGAPPPQVRITLTDISEHKRAEHIVNLQEDVRRQLSAELHGRTSPNLAAIRINLGILATLTAEQSVERAERIEDIGALLADTDASIREISSDLRPPLLDYAGLSAALTGYAHQFAKRTGIAVSIDCAPMLARPTPAIESLLFRIAQEALTNCAKHANAKSAAITLTYIDNGFFMTIRDNGIGFDPARQGKTDHASGLGLLSMREMAEFAGGRLLIHSCPNQGTRIEVRVPWEPARM